MSEKYRAYAKVNIFLKVSAARGDYHEIISRFVRVDTLYDELCFVPKSELNISGDSFVILGEFSCETKQNTIYKAYLALLEATGSKALKELMQSHAIRVDKRIPAFAGLGGGSSDAASYLLMCNEKLELSLTPKRLAEIGLCVGADVPFFIYGYRSANVSGIGEIVEEFEEDELAIETYTPKIEISTPRVYRSYRENFFAPIDAQEVQRLKSTSSLDALTQMSAVEANDLFRAALKEYENLKEHSKQGYYFSGSGSSFFRVKEER